MLILMTYQAASQFEANFDDRAGGNFKISFFVGEPVLYHPGKVTDDGSFFLLTIPSFLCVAVHCRYGGELGTNTT